MSWRIGNGARMCPVIDPWAGCSAAYKLPEYPVNFLHNHGIHHLNQIEDQTSIWSQGWKPAQQLNIPPEYSVARV